MRQLHSRNAALLVNEANDALQQLDVIVAPDAEVLRTDPAFRQDRGRFCHHQSSAAYGATAEMHKVPVVSQSVSARVLTHRRDKDSISEFQIADRERIEQVSHANTIGWHVARGENLVLPRTLRARRGYHVRFITRLYEAGIMAKRREDDLRFSQTAWCVSAARKKFSYSVPTTGPDECRL